MLKTKMLIFKITHLSWIVVVLMLGSCRDNTMEMGDNFIHSSTYTELIDSVSLSFSTIGLDSIQTSGLNTAIVGVYQIPGFGTIQSTSYVPILETTSQKYDKFEVYDSMTIRLKLNTYYEGDTLVPFRLKIHEITQEFGMEKDSSIISKYYNIDSLDCHPDPFFETDLTVRPGWQHMVELRIPDEMGIRFWEYVKQSGYTTSTKFKDCFKGIKLDCDSMYTNSVISFKVDTTLSFRLYSHKWGETPKKIVRLFSSKANETSFQFNRIECSPIVNELHPDSLDNDQNVNELLTGGNSFLIASAGYKTRLDIPYLKSFKANYNNGVIIQADLILRPNMNNVKISDLPEKIYLVSVDKINTEKSYFTDSYGNYLDGDLKIDYSNPYFSYYRFDVTSFLNSELRNENLNQKNGLVITLPEEQFKNSLKRLTLNGFSKTDFASELKIYYYYFDKTR